jgi:hypothetical protein
MYKLQRLMISVDDYLLSQNVIFPLKKCSYNGVDIMVVAGGIKPPRVTLTRIEYSGKQEETLKHWT